MKKVWVLIPVLLLCAGMAEAAIFFTVLADRPFYRNGELIHINLEMDQENLKIYADFRQVDSNYDKRLVFTENNGTHYDVYYPISLKNNNSAENYTVFISAYDRVSGLSNGMTYRLELRHEREVVEDWGMLELDVTDVVLGEETVISVMAGQVMVCKGSLKNCSYYSDLAFAQLTEPVIINESVIIYRDRNLTGPGTAVDLTGLEVSLAELSNYIRSHPVLTEDQIRRYVRNEFDNSVRPPLIAMGQKFDAANEQSQKTDKMLMVGVVSAHLLAIIVVVILLYAYNLRKKTNYIK